MGFETDRALQEMYRDALAEQIVRTLVTGADWQQFKSIRDGARQKETQETDAYRQDYAARVDKVRRELLRKAGAKTHDHPTPFGVDRFNKDRINRQAQQIVRHDHANRVHRIVSDEVSALEGLRDDIAGRSRVKDIARGAFARAVDRRAGPDRRGPSRA
ncbi:MAG: hypothetical protein AAF376_19990 [Pseudomonadota bacterium]